MKEKTDVQRLASTIPLNVPITLLITCHETDFERDVVVRSKEMHSCWSCSMFCVDSKGRGGYYWIRPSYERDKMRVKGFYYA